MRTPATVRSAFTLIELLIVVAIIAILAAIAVPNFLEAQTRAKVSRLVSDFRAFKVGLESYRVDTNKLPEGDFPQTGAKAGVLGVGMYRLTTPIAYLTSINKSPFREDKIGADPNNPKYAVVNVHPLYVRAVTFTGGDPARNLNGVDYSDSYMQDRGGYLFNLPGNGTITIPPLLIDECSAGEYMIKSVGPDNIDNRSPSQTTGNATVYDPSNGTISDGDVVTFGDTSINAANR